MKVHLTTLGCPKNQVDSELMLGMLTAAGFPLAEAPEDAECLIVNTCAFIDRARQESVDTILELARLKERGSCRALIVTGCLTQRYGADILSELPEVDGILGTSDLPRIVELVGQAPAVTTGRPARRRAISTTRRRRGCSPGRRRTRT
jgi:ribosomal protein S12 methylthiotransferase